MEENGIENPRQYFTKWDKAEEEVNYHCLTSRFDVKRYFLYSQLKSSSEYESQLIKGV